MSVISKSLNQGYSSSAMSTVVDLTSGKSTGSNSQQDRSYSARQHALSILPSSELSKK